MAEHNILVIGNGYTGSRVTAHLRGRGHDVKTLDKVTGADWEMDYRVFPEDNLSVYTDVIWLAGHSSVKMCRDDPTRAVANNVTGLVNLALKLKDQKFIYASSISVHAVGGERNVYDATKRAADELIPVIYSKRFYGLRFGTVCGASEHQRWDLMVPAMWRSAKEEGVVRVSNPHNRRPLLGMTDLCRAVTAIVERGDAPAGLWDLCSVQESIASIGRTVADEVGASCGVVEGPETYSIEGDSTPFEEAFGFEFNQGVADMIREMDEKYGR